MQFSHFLAAVGHEVDDAEEGNALLQASGRDYRGRPETVLWKITPLFAQWLCSGTNILWESSLLHQHSTAIELGCGVAGVLALSLAPSIGQYIATDQEYVRKLFHENIEQNQHAIHHKDRTTRHRQQKSRRKPAAETPSQSRSRSRHHARSAESSQSPAGAERKIRFVPLDWETDALSGPISTVEDGFDVLLACDCVYNDALIAPFVQTCADIARQRPSLAAYMAASETGMRPTLCIVAQQLRAHEVFEGWLRESLAEFAVWRVKDEVLGQGLRTGSGYVVHVLVLRD
ncbi:predicted protein [Uncinocarpus reesii 1704]|uniref:Diaminohydroxyphosphoribosylamino-pyrimidine deaminase n=1 Tax=Uncinocarpus reesii (strain UAMH 1704) TaxID=336963 RepID=C4JJ57_UNCRE|nr:uncharacterized protein UREG_01664 [Uncinocarpus reesii 1704]EEP76815.1 predicted protein [Uncinocarpus reesii 1704]